MGACEVVDQEDSMNTIQYTWTFKCKCYTDDLINKLKAHFFAQGNQQLEVIDFFETYALLLQWTTVWLMIILEVMLGLN